MTRRGAPLGGDRPPTEGRDAGDGQFQHGTDPDYGALAARPPPPPNEETGLGWGRGGGAGKEKDLKGPPDVSLDGENDSDNNITGGTNDNPSMKSGLSAVVPVQAKARSPLVLWEQWRSQSAVAGCAEAKYAPTG